MTGKSNKNLATDVWENLFRAQVLTLRNLGKNQIWEDISMKEYDVLYVLSKAESGMQLKELQQEVFLPQPSLTKLVDRLESAQLLQKTKDETDKRAVNIALTQKGRAKQREVGIAHAKDITARITRALTTREQQQLLHLTQKLKDSEIG